MSAYENFQGGQDLNKLKESKGVVHTNLHKIEGTFVFGDFYITLLLSKDYSHVLMTDRGEWDLAHFAYLEHFIDNVQ